ncbi:hypothetical protein KHQ88_01140 [Mycoplasmatota bacterium]|nr:hypothetical protein KHQ88_01140 [Mycoplasmatota bacterium]
MKDFLKRKKPIIVLLLLILVMSNFTFTFAYWASHISSHQTLSSSSVTIGEWNYTNEVLTFRSDYQGVLSLTTETVEVNNKTAIQIALTAYGELSQDSQTELIPERDLLTALLSEIIAMENSVYLDFETFVQDSQFTGRVSISSRQWYGYQIYSSNDPNYDVWNDTRALALKTGAYFQSDDLFINGVDKITLYHGALNYNNGTSFQFKIEYELDSNPGTWLTLQEGGEDLLIDVISATPLTFSEIDVNIVEAVNIRFTPVIGNTSDYINLDDIRIYEFVVSGSVEAETFRTVYASTLALTPENVEISDKASVQQALAAYDLLSSDAKTVLTVEKTLLDLLLLEINEQELFVWATDLVEEAEDSYLQIDLDNAQAAVTSLPDSIEKTALQSRLDAVQNIIDNISIFRSTHANTLLLSPSTVQIIDLAAVQQALSDYAVLNVEAKAKLSVEKALLDSLIAEINNQIPTATQVSEFRNNHAAVLALSLGTVEVSNQPSIVSALEAYDSLTPAAQTELSAEKALLDGLLIEVATIVVVMAENSHLQADVDNAQIYVSDLPNGSVKTTLQNRLNQVQVIINTQAANAVNLLISALPSSGSIALSDESLVDAARQAYDDLTTIQKTLVTNLSVLTAAEAELIDLQKATNLVIIAESSQLQTDVDAARILVTALPNGNPKTELQDRLNAVEDMIAVANAQSIIDVYFVNNSVQVSIWDLFSDTRKESAFLSKANEIVSDLDVDITVTSSNRNGFTQTIYTIQITKNNASVSIVVDVDFST